MKGLSLALIFSHEGRRRVLSLGAHLLPEGIDPIEPGVQSFCLLPDWAAAQFTDTFGRPGSRIVAEVCDLASPPAPAFVPRVITVDDMESMASAHAAAVGHLDLAGVQVRELLAGQLGALTPMQELAVQTIAQHLKRIRAELGGEP